MQDTTPRLADPIADDPRAHPLNVPARLSHLQRSCGLPGWLDGQGLALAPADLQWFCDQWQLHWPEGLKLPHIYPTLEAGLCLEWDTPTVAMDVTVALAHRTAILNVSQAPELAVMAELPFDLNKPADWQALARAVQAALR